ncbi:ABC transporter substrate-binding protein [Roseococcus sp. YIM B11640]|uniref:ABC transporter substrate-binding protein n=1 Tax=Roseococcus sp. YIM B11640 TaxID=3133973 RepID=UPI003C7E3AB9
MHDRRRFMAGAGAALGTALAPHVVGAQGAASRTLRFVPQADLTVLDPVFNTATVTLAHGFMVFDTLYGLDAEYRVHPQMAAGHVVEDNARRWTITLREGLRFHDGEPVRARDCVASIRRWGARDMFGLELLAGLDELSAPDDRTLLFRFKRPFPLLPQALGKVTAAMPAIMPERLALTDPSRAVTEMIGSGPFRFVAEERVSGSRVVYRKNEAYVPRPDGVASRSAGPKIAHMERIEWHILPDPATQAAALQQGEVDWLEYAPNDLLPLLRRARNVKVQVTDDSSISVLRFNHLTPPFNNPAIRRAVLGALDQSEFLTAAFTADRNLWRTDVGVFLPNTPMANDAGLDVLRGPRDLDRVKRDLAAAGYNGEKVVVLQPMDLAYLKTMADVAVDMFRRAGMNAEAFSADWGTIVQRRASREPVERGGWSAFVTGFSAAGLLDPVANLGLRATGNAAWFGWPTSEPLERLRREWMEAPDVPAQQAIARQIQTQFFHDVPYMPLGEYFRIIAHQRNLVDIPVGLSTFTGVRRA